MESSTNASNEQITEEKIINSHAEVPDINNYITPLTNNNLNEIQRKIEAVIKTFKNKIELNSSLIIAKEAEIPNKENEFSNVKRVDSYEEESVCKSSTRKFNFIFDCLGFLHRVSDFERGTESEEPHHHEIRKLDKEQFKHILNLLNDKGVAVYLMDYHHLIQVAGAIKEAISELNVNLFIKQYIVKKIPLVGMLYIQKFEKSACNFEALKLLAYEIYEDNSITKPVSYLVKDMGRSLAYMNEMYQYQGFLSELQPGIVLKINIRENFWSDNIDFSLTIVDAEDPELIARNSCAAIIVTKAYTNDFLYLSKEGNMQLCKQANASRLILIRPNSFNNDAVQAIKDRVSHYILLFKFAHCADESIPIMLFNDSRNESYEVYRDSSVIIRDMVENEQKETFRQLIFRSSPNEIQSEVKLILSSKNKAKSDPENYTMLPTVDRYKEKNFVSCLDKNFICSFYIKCLLCGVFFISSEEFPKRSFEILVLGAGIGSVNHYFDKLLLSKVNIQSVEIDKSMPEIGQKFFGFKNFDKHNYKWDFGDAKNYLLLNKQANENKFDMIISDINNTNPNDGISPPPVFFDHDVLTAIKNSLRDTGVYIINLMARSYKNYNTSLEKLESVFENIFVVENTEDLNKIHFCFKKKFSNDDYKEMYNHNSANFGQNADMSIIEADYKRILNKIVDLSDIKPKKEE